MPLVGPALQEQHGVFCALQAAGTVQQAKGSQVAEAGNQTLIAGVQRAGEAPQPGLVEARHDDAALLVLQIAAVLFGDWRATCGADGEQ
ncbi:hypothetical protein D3C76_905970 [compost metagenome]